MGTGAELPPPPPLPSWSRPGVPPPPPLPWSRPARAHRSWALPLGRIGGVPVRVHASFAILVLLVAVGATVPHQPAVAEQVAWIVVLFGCVVLHELAHALVARRCGIRVTEIELLPLGGVSKLERQPDAWRDELRIAAAGPAASIAIGGALALVAVAAGQAPWPIALYGGAFVTRVVWMNVLLGGFNLLPAIPLDGGRVFRAALTGRVGHERATLLAVRASRSIAVALILAGLLVNVWVAAIGVFVLVGASAETTRLQLEHRLAGVRVGDLPVRALDPDASIATLPTVDVDDFVVQTPLLAGAPVVAVARAGTVVGTVTRNDVDLFLRRTSPRSPQPRRFDVFHPTRRL